MSSECLTGRTCCACVCAVWSGVSRATTTFACSSRADAQTRRSKTQNNAHTPEIYSGGEQQRQQLTAHALRHKEHVRRSRRPVLVSAISTVRRSDYSAVSAAESPTNCAAEFAARPHMQPRRSGRCGMAVETKQATVSEGAYAVTLVAEVC